MKRLLKGARKGRKAEVGVIFVITSMSNKINFEHYNCT